MKIKYDENGRRMKRHDPAWNDDLTPKNVRIYDFGDGGYDRYTVVFSQIRSGYCHFIGVNEGGICTSHGENRDTIDRPAYGHLGKKITFADLPKNCQTCVIREYESYWGSQLPGGRS